MPAAEFRLRYKFGRRSSAVWCGDTTECYFALRRPPILSTQMSSGATQYSLCASLNLTAITGDVLQHACNMPRRLQPASNSKECFSSPLLASYHCEVTSAWLGILWNTYVRKSSRGQSAYTPGGKTLHPCIFVPRPWCTRTVLVQPSGG